jgi:ABC-type antimicrobial peptide transport system permease subunit
VLFLSEAALLGLVGSGIGVVVAIAASRVADQVLDRVLPALPLLPETYFWLSWPIVIAGLSLGFLVSVVAAVSPALRAARMDPARVLRTA